MMNSLKPTIIATSETTFLLEWPQLIDENQHQHIMVTGQYLRQALDGQITDVVISYCTIMIHYNPMVVNLFDLKKTLSEMLNQPLLPFGHHQQNEITIPVYYGIDSGWDLEHVADVTEMTMSDVIELHTVGDYRAYATGFSPGFTYLGTLSQQLRLPRKESPRLRIPAGAVAIAGQQTAVYPSDTPGGWHVLGQTPLQLTTVKDGHMTTLIKPGDHVRFEAITQDEFYELGGTLVTEDSL